MIEFKLIKTTQLSKIDFENIKSLFAITFKKERSIEEFLSIYTGNPYGYSYHAIASDKNTIIGHIVFIPFDYSINRVSFITCLSVDAMVHPEYRGKGIYGKLTKECEAFAFSKGVKLRMGIPNDNSYPIQIKSLKYCDLGAINTYFLPLKPSAVNKRFSFLNPFASFLSKFLISLSKIPKNKKIVDFPIKKDIISFNDTRYNWFDGNYVKKEKNKVFFIYKNGEFKGIKATFLLDVFPLSKFNFDLAVREIYKDIKNHSPFLIYVGNLPFKPLSLIKIPHRIEPKRFNFVVKVLDSNFFRDKIDIYNIKNWNLNLSNFDLI